MYLRDVEITGFRCIGSLKVSCHKGVNILIGENNTGKTAVLDALRLCFGTGTERRDLYVQPEDFHVPRHGAPSSIIEVHLTFEKPTDREQGIFVELLAMSAAGTPEIKYHTRYTYDGDRIRRKHWGGENEGQEIPSEVLELFCLTHLGALRDATRDLAPNRGNKLSQLFLKLVEKPKRELYARSLNQQLRALPDWQKLLSTGKEKIETHLKKVALEEDAVRLKVDFVETTFQRLAENLKLFLPRAALSDTSTRRDQDMPYADFEISQNGLGYNNLIYISTVLGDLLERREKEPDSYIGLLIEEPEAHLHPQWQNVLFSYLQEIESKGIQVFITSHSPTITAKTKVDSLILMTRTDDVVRSSPIRTFCISLPEKKHLQRFLDVTKCQLFFSRSVVLVEGLSEVLLLPTLARICGYDLTKAATEIVNIDGVGFEPFAKLFNSPETDQRINVRCALITDGDPKADGTFSDRATKATELKGGMLRVFVAPVTFEHELYLLNGAILKEVYQSRHPKTCLHFSDELEIQAVSFVEKINANKDKAALAQDLVAELEQSADASFSVPPYLSQALDWVLNGKDPD